MKKLILAVAAVMVSVAAFAQGTVVFNNRVGTEVNARVLLPNGDGVGAGWTAQLFGGPAGATGDALKALTPTTTFRTSSAAALGYINGVVVDTGLPANSSATLVMRVYNGADYASSAGKGESGPITITLGGGPNPPANLTGLQGFSVTDGGGPGPIIPEPSTVALVAVGVGALLLRRRK